MPLNADGTARLTFEEWIDYHDKAQMDLLDRDRQQWEENPQRLTHDPNSKEER